MAKKTSQRKRGIHQFSIKVKRVFRCNLWLWFRFTLSFPLIREENINARWRFIPPPVCLCLRTRVSQRFLQAEGFHGVAGSLGDSPDHKQHAGRLQQRRGAARRGHGRRVLPAPLPWVVALHRAQRWRLITCNTERGKFGLLLQIWTQALLRWIKALYIYG